jgi:hypothetical protein
LSPYEPTRVNLPKPPITFTDVSKSHWAYTTIRSATAKGLMVGYGNGKFGPSDTLTNSQIAQNLFNAYDDGLRSKGVSYNDVKISDWFFNGLT